MIVVETKITSADGLLMPAELPALLATASQTVPGGGVEPIVLSGRLPVWAFGALIHWFHPRPWVATFEPRLRKGVVVASHTPGVSVGDLVEIDEPVDRVVIRFPGEGGAG